jgi:hypothetical protein
MDGGGASERSRPAVEGSAERRAGEAFRLLSEGEGPLPAPKEKPMSLRLILLVAGLIVARAVDQVLYYRIANILGALPCGRVVHVSC